MSKLTTEFTKVVTVPKGIGRTIQNIGLTPIELNDSNTTKNSGFVLQPNCSKTIFNSSVDVELYARSTRGVGDFRIVNF